MDWCSCGSLDGITDAEGNETRWERDLQGRVEKEIRADDEFWEYTYEVRTSRLKSAKDPKLQVKTFAYDLDDKLTGISYTDEVNETPNVTLGYVDTFGAPDPYGRLRSMVDGTGLTTYGYHPTGAVGALKLASVDGPITGSGDLLQYSYDEMGRIKSRKLNGAANEVSYRFDSLGRLRTQVAIPGTFTYAYDGVTGRPTNLTYPNGQSVAYAYHSNLGDHRLQEIHNKVPGGATLSKFGYTYSAPGNIETWSQQRGAGAPATYEFAYDVADQLRTATPIGPPGPVYEDTYDDTGNRVTHAVDSNVTIATYNNRNWLMSKGPEETVPIPFQHDDNGNITSDGTQNYFWDAENRLVAVHKDEAIVATFVYDGNGRRARKIAGGLTRTYLYDGAQIVEERLSTGGAIKYFDGPGIDQHLGFQDSFGAMSYFASDHLGSVTDMTSEGGGISLSRQYDPWGNLLSGSSASGYAFTGREWDAETGLYYYRARYYDPKIGRFISEDPIRFKGGINFYAYVEDDPINYTDPTGLILFKCTRPSGGLLGLMGGNHVYFCNPASGESCGKGKQGGKSRPRQNEQCPGPNCVPIPGSDGKEDKVMNCCKFQMPQDPANNDFFPYLDDCHTYVNRCLLQQGLVDPDTGGRTGCISGPCDPYSPSPNRPHGSR